MAKVAKKAAFDIRKVMEGLYAIDGIFRDEVDYFAPSPLYQKRRQHHSEPSGDDQSLTGASGGGESRNHSEDR